MTCDRRRLTTPTASSGGAPVAAEEQYRGARFVGWLVTLRVDVCVERRVLLDRFRAERQHAALGRRGADLRDRRVGQARRVRRRELILRRAEKLEAALVVLDVHLPPTRGARRE